LRQARALLGGGMGSMIYLDSGVHEDRALPQEMGLDIDGLFMIFAEVF
jgi:hypothetical protein